MNQEIEPGRGNADVFWRALLVFGLGLLVAVSAFGAGLLTERDLIHDDGAGAAGTPAAFSRLDEVRDLVDQEYFGRPRDGTPESSFDQSLEDNAIQGMMSGLDDYSTFLVPS